MARKKSNTLVWGLLILLVLALGGFGATSFSGTTRSLGSVGDKPLRISTYFSGVQNRLSQLSQQTGQAMTFQQAQMFGVPDSVLGEMVSNRMLDVEADRVGLSVGDEVLRDQIVQIPAFQGATGEFDRESYRFALDRTGLREKEFEDDLREDTARQILSGAVIGGTRMPAQYGTAMTAYLMERRAITYAVLGEDELAEPVGTPDDAALQAYYDDNLDAFSAPERKRITYVRLSPEMAAETVEIADEDVRAQYDARLPEFQQPERRLVERLVFADDAAAADALARIEAGETDFDTLVEDRGLTLNDVDLGDVSADQLGEAGEVIFAAASGDVVGPAPSNLGPALFRINGVLAAQDTTFEEAAADLRGELATVAATRAINAEMEPVEDLLAGGATLEEVAGETPLELGTIDWDPSMGEGIAANPDFSDYAETLEQDAYPELEQLADGTIFAMRLDEVIPAAPRPLDEVRDAVAAAWRDAQITEALQSRGQQIVAEVAGGSSLEDTGLPLQTNDQVSRNGQVAGAPDTLAAEVFGMEEGDLSIVAGDGTLLIVRLDAITRPDADDEATAPLRQQVAQQATSGLAQDIYQAYLEDIRSRVDTRIDQETLNSVNAQFP